MLGSKIFLSLKLAVLILKKWHIGSARPQSPAFRNRQNRSIFEFANSIRIL